MAEIKRWFKDFVNPDPDPEFMDVQASQLVYLSKLQNNEISFDPSSSHLSLEERAKRAVGTTNFDALLAELDIDPDFRSLNENDVVIAIGIGVMGVLAAQLTNMNAESLEDRFLKFHQYFKGEDTCGASPADYRAGWKHRYIFGHDFNLFQKLPEGYTYMGKPVGGKSLYSLVFSYIQTNFPDSNGIGLHLKAVGHVLTHYLSDLPTHDGLPLPFSSFFTRWIKDETKISGYSASNPLMDALGPEFGSINAADVSTYAVIKAMIKGYKSYCHWGKETTKDDKDLHEAQLNTIAYGIAMVIQMMLLLTGVWGRTGKLNYLIAGPFLFNCARTTLIINRKHKKFMPEINRSIAILESEENTFEDWVREICS